ncbi:MAG: hypothetical protein ABSD74_20205 [Rhizomicrobium sp.]|jgi:hypothetical protein
MHARISQTIFSAVLLCAVAALPAPGAAADQSKKNNSQVIIVNGNVVVIKNGRVQTRTVRPPTMVTYHPPKPAPVPKGMPVVKGDAASCIKLVRDPSIYYDPPYYRARNDCDHRVRLWVFDTNKKQWFDSIIVESLEDATTSDYDGISVGEDQVIAACTMSGDATPPGCFPKISGGLYAVASNNVILR